ncbi:MAG: metal ABC transporter substrate-binding protein [Actinomycetota bacterium]|nr:metal ABC transporter substrate-binding protein [Actinomycetota bacterium]
MGRKPLMACLHAIVAGATALAVAACGGVPATAPTEAQELEVVATTSILANVVGRVVGDAGRVTPLMQVGTDPHAFQPSPAQVRLVEEADVVVTNGLGLEASLLDALAAAEERGTKVIRVAEAVDPLPYSAPQQEHAHDEHAGESEKTGSQVEQDRLDPHFWQDPLRMLEAVRVIAAGLAAAVPAAADTIPGNAEAYARAVQDLHAEIEQTLAAVPPPNRKLVTNHETLDYFAARYGFEIIGTVVPGGGTLAETSSQQLAELAATIREVGVRTIFVETITSPRLAEALSQQLGGQVEVVELYTDSLGPEGSEASTYLDMMRTNARRIGGALRT